MRLTTLSSREVDVRGEELLEGRRRGLKDGDNPSIFHPLYITTVESYRTAGADGAIVSHRISKRLQRVFVR